MKLKEVAKGQKIITDSVKEIIQKLTGEENLKPSNIIPIMKSLWLINLISVFCLKLLM